MNVEQLEKVEKIIDEFSSNTRILDFVLHDHEYALLRNNLYVRDLLEDSRFEYSQLRAQTYTELMETLGISSIYTLGTMQSDEFEHAWMRTIVFEVKKRIFMLKEEGPKPAQV